jgi:hypothetical protein
VSYATKKMKLHRRENEAKRERWRRNHAKSGRLRAAQGGVLWDWDPRALIRPPKRLRRGTWNVRGCPCGHKRHGKYGCLRGCAWGSCTRPVLLGDIHFDDMVDAVRYSMLKAGVFVDRHLVVLAGDIIGGLTRV